MATVNFGVLTYRYTFKKYYYIYFKQLEASHTFLLIFSGKEVLVADS